MDAERRVLLVDDDTSNLEVLGDVLRSEGYAVVCARNGAEALACLNSARPDVVMLDYVMPTMDGATMARRLRDDERTRGIAIVMTSGLPEDMVRPRCACYDAFLQKPYDVGQALATLETLTKRQVEDSVAAAFDGNPCRVME
jgi:two-component system phosphate regulon response regulator PhoB